MNLRDHSVSHFRLLHIVMHSSVQELNLRSGVLGWCYPALLFPEGTHIELAVDLKVFFITPLR